MEVEIFKSFLAGFELGLRNPNREPLCRFENGTGQS